MFSKIFEVVWRKAQYHASKAAHWTLNRWVRIVVCKAANHGDRRAIYIYVGNKPATIREAA
jgi:hypothetical protein